MESRSKGFALDEASFQFDQAQIAESARKFPAHRHTEPIAHPDADMTYLAAPRAEFASHAWDECGHL